jgi:hypothetical protein
MAKNWQSNPAAKTMLAIVGYILQKYEALN